MTHHTKDLLEGGIELVAIAVGGANLPNAF